VTFRNIRKRINKIYAALHVQINIALYFCENIKFCAVIVVKYVISENGTNCSENYGIEFRTTFVFFGYVVAKCWKYVM